MSTIFGIFNRNKKRLNDSYIKEMEDSHSYWEADCSKIWKEDYVTLGHRMLWKTPESRSESLPFKILQSSYILAITLDARLDNRKELAIKLEIHDFATQVYTDSELILAAYKKWGKGCPQYLLGDFVFVIWDELKQELFCVRDHIGIKSFYYYINDDIFIFSNDLKGLVAHSFFEKKYNDRSLAMILAGSFGFYDERETFYQKIQKLPAASSLVVAEDEILEFPYWDINNIPAVHYDTYAEYSKKLKELLIDAVNVRLRTCYPVASHLSGGLDSSSIATIAARELEKKHKPLYVFNWIETPEEECDPDYPEWGFASQLVSRENMIQRKLKLTSDHIMELYCNLDATEDNTAEFGEYLVRDESEKLGIRTILSGWGGDELISFNGYTYLSGLFWSGRLFKAIEEVEKLYKGKDKKILRVIKRSLREILDPIFEYKIIFAKQKLFSKPYEFTSEKFGKFIKAQTFDGLRFRPGVHSEQKALFKMGHLLKRVEESSLASYVNKVEYSYPLLDKRIVEFALSVPEEMYAIRNGYSRYLFRSTVSEFLPENIALELKITDGEHSKAREKLREEGLKKWLKINQKQKKKNNYYIDRSKIIERLETYFFNKENQIEDSLEGSSIGASILLANLEDKQ